jgi:hypothetical protein
MTALMYTSLGVSLALTLIFILVRVKKGGLAGVFTKTLASVAFVISGLLCLTVFPFEGEMKWGVTMVVIGLIFGMLGDIILDLKVVYNNDAYYLNAGMLSFGLGHIAYIAGFCLFAIALDVALLMPVLVSAGVAIAFTIGNTLSGKKMGLDFGKFFWQTMSYSVLLTFMATFTLILAIQSGVVAMWVAFAGFMLFLASDLVLSFQYFGGKLANKTLIVVNHLLYYLAQITVVASMFALFI